MGNSWHPITMKLKRCWRQFAIPVIAVTFFLIWLVLQQDVAHGPKNALTFTIAERDQSKVHREPASRDDRRPLGDDVDNSSSVSRGSLGKRRKFRIPRVDRHSDGVKDSRRSVVDNGNFSIRPANEIRFREKHTTRPAFNIPVERLMITKGGMSKSDAVNSADDNLNEQPSKVDEINSLKLVSGHHGGRNLPRSDNAADDPDGTARRRQSVSNGDVAADEKIDVATNTETQRQSSSSGRDSKDMSTGSSNVKQNSATKLRQFVENLDPAIQTAENTDVATNSTKQRQLSPTGRDHEKLPSRSGSVNADSAGVSNLRQSDKREDQAVKTDKATSKSKTQRRLSSTGRDYENLIFVQHMANASFVEVDVASIPKAESPARAPQQHHELPHRVSSFKSPTSVQASTVEEGSVVEMPHDVIADADQMDFFAQLPESPDYDLPLLKKKTASSVAVAAASPNSAQAAVADGAPRKDDVFVWPPVGYNNSQLPKQVAVESGGGMIDDDDDVMSNAVILGKVDPTKPYAVFSTTTDNREALGFIFVLPLTVLAWKRIGFESVIVIVGSVDSWNGDGLFHFVLSSIRELEAVVIFLEPRPEKSVMISQVSRIFVANILRAFHAFHHRDRPDGIDDVYIVTTDADIWPIYGDAYRLPKGKEVLSLNSDCCGAFSHRGSNYRMLPMANVGMNVSMWRRLTRRFGHSPQSVDDILTCVVQEFGPVALRPVHKGDNVGWFIDQMMVSLLISHWIQQSNNNGSKVKFVPRDVGVDRIDRNGWNVGGGGVTVEDKIDSHLLQNAYLPGVWVQLLPLMRALYGYRTDRYAWCTQYYDTFQRLYLDKYSANR